MTRFSFLFCLFLSMGLLQAQNMTMPTDLLQTMKTSLEAAGAGSMNLGPMGVFGNISGQFGLKINKEQTSSGNTAKLVRKKKRSISQPNSSIHPMVEKMLNNIDANRKKSFGWNSSKNMKNCFGIPIYIPVVRIVANTPPPTTTSGTPDARSDSTTTVATQKK